MRSNANFNIEVGDELHFRPQALVFKLGFWILELLRVSDFGRGMAHMVGSKMVIYELKCKFQH